MQRTLGVLLAVSVGANLVLVAATLHLQQRRTADASANAAALDRVRQDARTAAEAGVRAESDRAAAARKAIWSGLASEDLPTLVANLRAAGFPDRLARAVVTEILSEQYDSRRRAILGEEKVPPFWQTRASAIDPAKLAELRTLAREQQDRLKQLFGGEPRSDESLLIARRMYGELPAEKLEAVQRIQSDYADMQRQIRSDAGGLLLPEDRENLALLERERRKDLAAALTPAELETLDLYGSSTANLLRSRLAGFNPTEPEFRAVYALQSAFDAQFNSGQFNFGDDAAFRARQAAEQQLQAQIKAALGDARYDDFQRAQDPGFRVASRIADRLQLPADTAAAVYNLQREVAQKLAVVRDDPEATAAVTQEANDKLTALLGPQGAAAYRQTAGNWSRTRRGGRGPSATGAATAGGAGGGSGN